MTEAVPVHGLPVFYCACPWLAWFGSAWLGVVPVHSCFLILGLLCLSILAYILAYAVVPVHGSHGSGWLAALRPCK